MKDRFVKGGYLLWVVVHLFLLFAVSEGVFDKSNYNGGIDDFVPFTYYSWEEQVTTSSTGDIPFHRDGGYSFGLRKYDITEFLFYLIVPVLLYFAIKLLRPQPIKEDE